jgi:hypothetical protein
MTIAASSQDEQHRTTALLTDRDRRTRTFRAANVEVGHRRRRRGASAGQSACVGERDAAGHAAAAAPGVVMVDNQIEVEPPARTLDQLPDEYC